MNKQAVLFLTLFSCVLMLSIYYVTTPIPKDIMVAGNSKTIHELTLQVSERIKKDIDTQSKIIASTTATSSDKKVALLKLDELKQQKELSSQISLALSACSYENVVDVSGNIVKMTVVSETSGKNVASNVIGCAYEVGRDEHLYEVTFLLK